MSWQPPGDLRPPAGGQPSAPRNDLNLYAILAIVGLVVAARFSVVPILFAFLGIMAIVATMARMRTRANRRQYEAQVRAWYLRNPHAEQHAGASPPVAPPPKNGWSTAGTVLAVVAVVFGLATLAGLVLLALAFSSNGNK